MRRHATFSCCALVLAPLACSPRAPSGPEATTPVDSPHAQDPTDRPPAPLEPTLSKDEVPPTEPTAPTAPTAQAQPPIEPAELLPYPGTRQLCDQRVYSHGGDIREIHWTLHASKDRLAQVAEFYRNQPGHAESPQGAGASFDFGNGRIVTVFEKSRRREHPGCDTAPNALEQTLILTSVAR